VVTRLRLVSASADNVWLDPEHLVPFQLRLGQINTDTGSWLPSTPFTGSHVYPVGTATSNCITMFSPVRTVEETALIDSSVMASFEVALAGREIKLVIETNEIIENHILNFFIIFVPRVIDTRGTNEF
jgi:hypothetical protein